MTFGDLHLKLPWSGGIYPNPLVVGDAALECAQQTHPCTLARWHKLRKGNNLGACREGRSRETCREERVKEREGEEQRRAGLVLSVSQDAQGVHGVRGVRGVTHTTEPSVEATCLIMANVCIWGKTVAGSSRAWAGEMARWQLLRHYVRKRYTHAPGDRAN